jgi:uncharacterized protein
MKAREWRYLITTKLSIHQIWMIKYSQNRAKYRNRLRNFMVKFDSTNSQIAMRASILFLLLILSTVYFSCQQGKGKLAEGPRRIEILFLGHGQEHHNSAQYAPMLAAALGVEGINLTYTEDPADLNPETLSYYDGLMLYANHDSITVSQETALLDFVEDGKGFIPIHSASFCFRNSEKFVNLVGGQFLKHDTGTFVTSVLIKDHPAMQSVPEFSTWDETYVHHKLTNDRTTLTERVEGDHHEPWTWVRAQGEGRVFYTAYGHDERTWQNPGFHQLVKQGIVWAVGDKVKAQWEEFRKSIPALVYKDMPDIPNYEKRNPLPQFQEPLSPEALTWNYLPRNPTSSIPLPWIGMKRVGYGLSKP